MIYLLVLIVIGGRRKNELTNNKSIKGKYLIRIYLKDIFGYAENQEKGTYGLG